MCIPCHRIFSMAFCLLVHSFMPIYTSVTEPYTVGAQIYDDEDDDDDYKELRKSERGRQRDIITRILCIHWLLVVVLLSSSVTQSDSQRCPQDAFVSNSTVNHAPASRCPSDCCPLRPSLWTWINDAQTRLVARSLSLSPSN